MGDQYTYVEVSIYLCIDIYHSITINFIAWLVAFG